jgi:hypothetical protein
MLGVADEFDQHAGYRVRVLIASITVAIEVLRHCLGTEWITQNIMDPSGVMRLKFIEEDGFDSWRSALRIIKMAEMMINFRQVQGFKARCERILTGDLASTVAELDTAEMLYMSEIPFRFVEETGKIGFDYDMEAIIGGTATACEVKCKIDNTKMSSNTIENAIGKARKQLPTDKPGIVFLRVPEAWDTDASFSDQLMKAVANAFRASKRLSAVIVHWKQWDELNTGRPEGTRTFTKHNENARYPLVEFGGLITSAPKWDLLWRSIPSLLLRHGRLI